MPQKGERKTQNGVTGEFDGQTWRQVPAEDPSATGGYHPGLEDSSSPWVARLKGFLSGASEAATPGKIGTMATLAMAPETMGLSVPAAALAAGGTTAAVDLLRSYFKTGNAPQSGNEFLADVGGSAAAPVAGALVGKGASLLGDAVGQRKVGTAIGALTGGYEGYEHGGVPGAAAGAVTGGVAGAFGQTKLQKLGKLFGMTEGAAAPVAAEEVGGFAPGASRGRAGGGTMISHNELGGNDVPDFSGRPPARDPQEIDPRAIKAATMTDPHMANSSGYDPLKQGSENDIAYPRQSNQGATDAVFDRYMPNTSPDKPLPEIPDSLSMLDDMISANGDNASPGTIRLRDRLAGKTVHDPISGLDLAPEDMPQGFNMDAARNRRASDQSMPASLQGLTGQGSTVQDPFADDVRLARDLLNTGYSRDAAVKIGAGRDSGLADRLRSTLDTTDTLTQDPEWESGAESGSDDAAIAARLHRNQAINDQRLRHLWERDQ